MEEKPKGIVVTPDLNNVEPGHAAVPTDQASKRLKWAEENIKLLQEAARRGKRISLRALYMNRPEFEEISTREAGAQMAAAIERDIIIALTYCRLLQEKGQTSAPIDYNLIEY